MSNTEVTSETTRSSHKDLAKARAQLVSEFKLNPSRICQHSKTEDLLSLLEQEPYNMVKGRDGGREPSKYFRVPIYKYWQLVNGEKEYTSKMTYNEKQYSRDQFIYYEPITRADVKHQIKTDLAKHGYHAVYFQDVPASEWRDQEIYVKIRV